MSLNCHSNNCNTPGMEASRAAELACTGALSPRCFPAHPLPGVTVQPGSTACFTLQLACDGAQKGVTSEKSQHNPHYQQAVLIQPAWLTLEIKTPKSTTPWFFPLLTVFYLKNPGMAGLFTTYSISTAPPDSGILPREKHSWHPRSLTRHTWNLCISSTLRYLQLSGILPCPLPCAFSGFFPRAQNCNPRVVPSTNWAASPGTCTLFHWHSLVCCPWQVSFFLSCCFLPSCRIPKSSGKWSETQPGKGLRTTMDWEHYLLYLLTFGILVLKGLC